MSLFNIKQQLLTLILALRDKHTPMSGKVLAVFSILYLLSPVDVVFDVVPFAGILDDLLLVPFGLWLSKQQIPVEVLLAARKEAKRYNGVLNKILTGLIIFCVAWLLVALALIYLLVRTLF